VKVVWLLLLVFSCVQKPPHATLVVDPAQTTASPAVLVLPMRCTSRLVHAQMCDPVAYESDNSPRHEKLRKSSFANFIDPALRLKLEFAGYTLAEAGAMRIARADRVDHNGESTQIEGGGPQTVADLDMPDVQAVATSLALPSLLVTELTIRPGENGMVRADLVVSMLETATLKPRWSVTCSELMYGAVETPNRLANCVGNGVLAILAPENVIGKSL